MSLGSRGPSCLSIGGMCTGPRGHQAQEAERPGGLGSRGPCWAKKMRAMGGHRRLAPFFVMCHVEHGH